ncbi:hypothetical protein U729_3266 (plasmid) [Clostridium baratii str. Sullivan]|uniref:Uncharacterized protein n=1 Tax=Clostridium baratii str. Sullivan TaxID=1415775 RepID=A0A0A7G027_9CLOT|nr:hypothetical protein [Clostridium baratii]AIY85229.1 hypothetical protein U729_3266 [Clostridium baratii str. Sullivan]
MFKMKFTTNSMEKTVKFNLDRNEENIRKAMLYLFSKFKDAVVIVDEEDKDFEEVLKEMGRKYEVAENEEDLDKDFFDKLFTEAAKEVKAEEEAKERQATEEEVKKLEEDLKILEGDVNKSFRFIGKTRVEKILNSTPEAGYYELITALNKRIKEVEEITDGEENKSSKMLKDLKASLEEKAYNIEEMHPTIINIFAKFGIFVIGLAAVFLGIAKFAVNTLVVGVTLIVRVGYNTCKETVGACKSIKRSFDHNILNKKDAFKVEVSKKETEDAIKRNEELISKLRKRLEEMEEDK